MTETEFLQLLHSVAKDRDIEFAIEEITMESNFKTELHLDSLDQLDLVMGMEKHFNIMLDYDGTNAMETVVELYELTKSKI